MIRTPGGVDVVAPFGHSGPARAMVHRLKYDADLDAGRLLAVAMAKVVHPACDALIPVPRVLLRRLRHGIDVGLWLSTEVGRLVGLPVLPVLTAGLWWPSRAGGGYGMPSFRCRHAASAEACLVDDVVTTGSTLEAAAAAAGTFRAVVATVALGPLVTGRG